MENLVYLYILKNPRTNAKQIYRIWQKSKIFREYERPDETELQAWVSEIKQELYEKGIKLKLN